MSTDYPELTNQTEQSLEPVQPLEPHNINRAKLPEPLLDNPNISDCSPASPSTLEVCIHDVDNCNQPSRKTVQTPQMG
jgi:hypothetical protein